MFLYKSIHDFVPYLIVNHSRMLQRASKRLRRRQWKRQRRVRPQCQRPCCVCSPFGRQSRQRPRRRQRSNRSRWRSCLCTGTEAPRIHRARQVWLFRVFKGTLAYKLIFVLGFCSYSKLYAYFSFELKIFVKVVFSFILPQLLLYVHRRMTRFEEKNNFFASSCPLIFPFF